MTFEEYGKLPPSEVRDMLTQAIAIISTHGRYSSMTLDKVFDAVAKQAETIRKLG